MNGYYAIPIILSHIQKRFISIYTSEIYKIIYLFKTIIC